MGREFELKFRTDAEVFEKIQMKYQDLSSHVILLLSIIPSLRDFSNESAVCIK